MPVAQWRAALGPDVRALIDDDAEFRNFPHFDTVTEETLSPSAVNLLADMMTWIVLHPSNRAILDDAVRWGAEEGDHAETAEHTT